MRSVWSISWHIVCEKLNIFLMECKGIVTWKDVAGSSIILSSVYIWPAAWIGDN